jgi:hypothetical protein
MATIIGGYKNPPPPPPPSPQSLPKFEEKACEARNRGQLFQPFGPHQHGVSRALAGYYITYISARNLP